MVILGARPQFVKAAPLLNEIKKNNDKKMQIHIQPVVIHTGQHSDYLMSGVFFEQLGISEPNYNLGINNLSHAEMTGLMMIKIEQIIEKELPDYVIVFGDTNSTLAGALAAAKHRSLPYLVHIEAGLRSHNTAMPEEVNRVLTDRLSHILFCPTKGSKSNLALEGFPFQTARGKQSIEVVGDIMVDSTMQSKQSSLAVDLNNWGIKSDQFLLCTFHRQDLSSFPKKIDLLLKALGLLAQKTPIYIPLHPRIEAFITEERKTHINNLHFLKPLPYFEMQKAISKATVILTDSGGLQKEAYLHGVPCITLRDETEWTETVELGANILTGLNLKKIIEAYEILTTRKPFDTSCYGQGDTAQKIVGHILKHYAPQPSAG